MKYCKENIYNYWSCCPSINLSNYVTEEELEEKISGITGGCDCDAITRQIEALQGAIVSIGDRITILENKMAQKADLSAITEIWDAIAEISGDTPTPTPTPTPDTGETTTKKLVVTVLNKDNYELDCDADDYLDSTQTKPDNDYLSYLTAEVGDCITEIGDNAFQYCRNLTAVTLPSTIEVIHNYAFTTEIYGETANHLDIYINAVTPPTLDQDNVGADSFFASDCTIYVPAASVNAYKTAWPTYADKIEAMN